MQQLNPDSMTAIQPELTSGENFIWAGRPSGSVIFHKEDAFLVPFSLLWARFDFGSLFSRILGGAALPALR